MLLDAPPQFQPKRIVIFDLDGTLADTSHRLHFIRSAEAGFKPDWDAFFDACSDDTPLWPFIVLGQELSRAGHPIIIVTGRSARVRDKTLAWLTAHNFPAAQILMRPEGNFKPDDEIKREWFEASGLKPQDISYVFEDRTRCVKMWRDLGIPCLQVSEGDY